MSQVPEILTADHIVWRALGCSLATLGWITIGRSYAIYRGHWRWRNAASVALVLGAFCFTVQGVLFLAAAVG